MTGLPARAWLCLVLARRELRGARGFSVFLACLALGVGIVVAVGLLTSALRAGLLAEAEYVWHNREAFRTAAQAIGYKEFFPYFQQTATLEACTEKLKQASRNYAKRQLTWFRHMDGVTWLDAGAADVRQTALRLTQDFLLKG